MISLLKFEFRKLLRMKMLYIGLGLLLFGALINVLITYFMYKLQTELFSGMGADYGFEAEGSIFTDFYVPTAVDIVMKEIAGQIGTVVIALFVTLVVCDDNNSGTLKNIYSKGYTRNCVYYSKLVVCIAVSFVMMLAELFFAFIFGCMFFKVGGDSAALSCIVVQTIALLASVTMCYFFVTLIKKTGGAIVCNILVPIFLPLVFTLIDLIAGTDTYKVADYWLSGMINKVANGWAETSYYVIATVLSLVYAAAFVVGGMFINKKREV